jgi:predicted HTH domain antitoxin
MAQILLDLPEESLMAFDGSEERAGKELRMAAAVKLYEMGHLSSGAAARLAGIPRAVFLFHLADYGVDTFRFNEEEFEKETRIA